MIESLPRCLCWPDKRPFRGWYSACVVRKLIPVPGYLPYVGFRTGEGSVDCLDIDPPAFDWFEGVRERIPPTRIQRTPRGGFHVFFTHHPGVGCSRGALPPGVDVKGDGGGVVDYSIAGYEVVNPDVIADWPEWLLALARSRSLGEHPLETSRSGSRPRGAQLMTPGELSKPLYRAVCRLNLRPLSFHRGVIGVLRTVEQAKPGNRNNALHWAACRFAEIVAEGRLDRADAERLLMQASEANGLDAAEGWRTIRSGLGRGEMK